MGKHNTLAARRIKCPWRKAIAITMATVTAGAWIPFATSEEEPPAEDPDESSSVPEALHEAHGPLSWPVQPPVSLVKHKPPALHNPADHTPQHHHTPPPTTHTVPPPSKRPKPPPPTSRTSVLVAFLRAQLGERYVLGGNGPDIWDCSGLTLAAYNTIGIALPRTSELQSLRGTRVSLGSLEVGDLLFWGVGPGLAFHVAIYIGGGQYIAAQNPSVGVVQRSLSYSPPDFARRIL